VSDVTCHVPTQGDNVDSVAAHPTISSPDDVLAIRRSRRQPALTQFDYLHLTALTAGLRDAIEELPDPVTDVLDVWCGSRPYDDLLPEGARSTGLDVEGNPYGVADVVSNDFLPFPDASFDLVMCVQSFHYMVDPAHAVAEIERVLRPGGSALVSSVLGFEYDRRNYEARYTEHQLRALFRSWDDVRVREDGGRTVTWAVLTGSLVNGVEQRVDAKPAGRLLRPAFLASYALVNAAGLVLRRLEPPGGTSALPMNLTLTARKPALA
jgi:SAM-dependent methyltransferase